jgi:hypothetical protein
MMLILAAVFAPIAIGAVVRKCVTRTIPLGLAWAVHWSVYWDTHHFAEAVAAAICAFIAAAVTLDVLANHTPARPVVLVFETAAAAAVAVCATIALLNAFDVTGWVFVASVTLAGFVASAKLLDFRGALPAE